MSRQLSLAARCYARYVAPLTLLSALLFAPWLAYAGFARVPSPMISWAAVASAWIAQFMLVGAAASLIRGLVAGAPLSQLAATRASAGGLVGCVLPCLIAVAAIAIASIALIVPGLVLLVLLSLTGASGRSGLSEPLLDSVERVRVDVRHVALVVAGILIVDLAMMAIPFLLLRRPSSLEVALRIIAIAVTVVSPFAACVLAALAARKT